MNGAHWLVESLKRRGVEYIFALCGNGLKPFLDACVDLNMPVVDTRNEQSAAYMADAWGRMTKRLGVVAVSAGPGHTNALTGLANAFWDGGPMLLISGCAGADTRGMGQFQELDQTSMAAPITKYARFVDRVEILEHELTNALSAALSGRPGPVHLTIPVDVLSAPTPEPAVRRLTESPGPIAQVNPRACGDPDLARDAVELLADAERPAMIVGNGAFYADAGDALARFADLTGVPIFSHIWSRGCIETPSPQYVGTTFGGATNGAFGSLAEADVALLLGAEIDYRIGYGRPPVFSDSVRFIRVDADPNQLLRPIEPEIGIAGDVRSVLEQMSEAGKSREWRHQAWLATMCERRDALLAKWAQRGREEVCPLPSLRICREIQPFLDRDVTFLLDGGNIGRWAHMVLWNRRHPAHWFTCGASGVVGWGVPGAVAAKLARPDQPLLLLSGDGAAGFTITEIETALRFNTPYVAVVAHDSAWGIEADSRPEGRRMGTVFGEIRFDRVAEALGGRGVYIEHPKQLAPAIERGLGENTATFIHVPTQLGGIGYIDKTYKSEET
jgi:acetolactate synthase-1/2/3 large subunit